MTTNKTIQPCKIKVTPKELKQIQEVCFANGIKYERITRARSDRYFAYLYIQEGIGTGLVLLFGEDDYVFEHNSSPEIKAQDFIDMYGGKEEYLEEEIITINSPEDFPTEGEWVWKYASSKLRAFGFDKNPNDNSTFLCLNENAKSFDCHSWGAKFERVDKPFSMGLLTVDEMARNISRITDKKEPQKENKEIVINNFEDLKKYEGRRFRITKFSDKDSLYVPNTILFNGDIENRFHDNCICHSDEGVACWPDYPFTIKLEDERKQDKIDVEFDEYNAAIIDGDDNNKIHFGGQNAKDVFKEVIRDSRTTEEIERQTGYYIGTHKKHSPVLFMTKADMGKYVFALFGDAEIEDVSIESAKIVVEINHYIKFEIPYFAATIIINK
jgi:hypothetical protein